LVARNYLNAMDVVGALKRREPIERRHITSSTGKARQVAGIRRHHSTPGASFATF
jgi:hypothetical protein